jgi:hypothetical protein
MLKIFLLATLMAFTGCVAEEKTDQEPVQEEVINNEEIVNEEGSSEENNNEDFTDFHLITLEGKENVRYLLKEVLEVAAALPVGTVVKYPKDVSPVNYDYRDSSGNVLRSSSGFYPQVEIVSVTSQNEAQFPADIIDKLNKRGLYVTSSLVPPVENGGVFKALVPGSMNAEYLSLFTETGKAKYNYTSYYTNRFGSSLNRPADTNSMSSRDRLKWEAVYEELKNAGNREEETPVDYLYLSSVALADKYTKAFEANGSTQPKGAWTMAVKSTAVRHGFPNVPCAEFMSEMIRQAYNRAGFDFKEDFSNAKGNYLIWDKTAAVVNLANSLHKAGWTPWELSKFNPPAGAIMMHYLATTPGHTYMAAGDNGRFVLDNGSPAGRDLRKTSKKTIEIMFKGGVFFLPPGVNPATW